MTTDTKTHTWPPQPVWPGVVDEGLVQYLRALDKLKTIPLTVFRAWLLRNGWEERCGGDIVRNKFACFAPTAPDDFTKVPVQLSGSVLGWQYVNRAPCDPRYGDKSFHMPYGVERIADVAPTRRSWVMRTWRDIVAITLVGNGRPCDVAAFEGAVDEILKLIK